MDLNNTATRYRITCNIGCAFLKLGQYPDAIASFERVMENYPEPQAGFNLVVCHYAHHDREKMKKSFIQLLRVPQYTDEDFEEENDGVVLQDNKKASRKDDELKHELLKRQKRIEKYVRLAARLIAPEIDDSFTAGYDWVIEKLKTPMTTGSVVGVAPLTGNTTYLKLALELEIAKGIAFLARQDFASAIETFKHIEKRQDIVMDQAACNLSFLYFLQRDLKNAEKHSEIAVQSNHFNAKALVNRGNCFFVQNQFEEAKQCYLTANGVEADCVESIYNLGMINLKYHKYVEAVQLFLKLHKLVSKEPVVMFQIANCYELLSEQARQSGDVESSLEHRRESAKWFKILHGVCPTDPRVLSRLGAFSEKEDKLQALHYYLDSYRNFPVNMKVISWLGVYYVDSRMFDTAIQYFQRASEIEPHISEWKLMIASCHRRMEAYPQALELYKEIHQQDPENLECLQRLCQVARITKDSMYEEYAKTLRALERKLERAKVGNEEIATQEEQNIPIENITIQGTGLSPGPSPPAEPRHQNTQHMREKQIEDEDLFGEDEALDDLLPGL